MSVYSDITKTVGKTISEKKSAFECQSRSGFSDEI